MKIKSLIVVDENGKEYAFTHRSIVEVKEYDASKDPEVQGTGLAEITSNGETSSPEAAKNTSSKAEGKVEKKLKVKKTK